MATETVAVSHEATPTPVLEKVEEKLNEEVKQTEHESGEPGPKSEELPSMEPALLKSEEKIEEDKPVEELPASVTTLSETEGKKEEDKPIVASVVKIEDIPLTEYSEVAQDPIREPDTPSTVPEAVDDGVKIQPEEQPEIQSVDKAPLEQLAAESTDKQPEEQPSIEFVDKESRDQQATESTDKLPEKQPAIDSVDKEQPQEQKATESIDTQQEEQPAIDSVDKEEPHEQKVTETADKQQEGQPATESIKSEPQEQLNMVDLPELPVEFIEKPVEPLEVSPVKEPEAITVNERDDLEAESVKEEKPEPIVPEVEGKSEEQPEVAEQNGKKCEVVDPKGSVPSETEKEEAVLPDKDTATFKEAEDELEGSKEKYAPGVVEKAGEEDIKKEASVANVVEGLSKEPAVELEKVKEENGTENSSKEDNEKENVISHLPTEPTKAEDVKNSAFTADVTTESFEGETKSRDVELVAENKKEDDMNNERPDLVESNKGGGKDGKLDENAIAVNNQIGEPPESKLEVKEEETEKAEANELEMEKVEETGESDVPNLEPSKVGDDTETSEVLPKEVSAKPTQKQSNNIITKVKKSLVKAKKAILGKSPSSKTISTENKSDIEVK